jgi:carboxylesterase
MPKGVLLIHGFAGGRYEVRPLADRLMNCGFVVMMPRLPGHEDTRAALSRVKYGEWIDSGIEAYEELSKKCDDVTVVGFSMGGLIAVQIHQKHQLDRLVTINTPIYVWDLPRAAQNLRSDFGTYARRYLDNSSKMSMGATAEFLRLLSATKPLFGSVRCPCLIIQAQDDDTVHRKSADFIYGSAGGEKRLIKALSGGHHILLTDGIDEISPRIVEFIENGLNA